ncbi:hypothetical protein SAMN05720469_1621, partial [Fibrobacter intestinalis]
EARQARRGAHLVIASRHRNPQPPRVNPPRNSILLTLAVPRQAPGVLFRPASGRLATPRKFRKAATPQIAASQARRGAQMVSALRGRRRARRLGAFRPPRRSCTTSPRPQGSPRPTPASGGSSAPNAAGRTVPESPSGTGKRPARGIAQGAPSTEWQMEKRECTQCTRMYTNVPEASTPSPCREAQNPGDTSRLAKALARRPTGR